MPTRSRYIIGAAVTAAAITLGAGVATAVTNGSNHDPSAEQQDERTYTDTHRGAAAISQARAEQLAQGAHPGVIVESHLQDEGALRWEVKTDDGHRVWEVQIDPSTGSITGAQPDE